MGITPMFGAAAAIAGLIFFSWRASVFARPYRLRLGEQVEQILSDPTVSRSDKRFAATLVKHAANPLVAILLAIVLPPLALVAILSISLKTLSGRSAPCNMDQREMRAMDYFFVSALCANPLFGAIVVAEGIVVAVVALVMILIFAVPPGVAEQGCKTMYGVLNGLKIRSIFAPQHWHA